METVGMPHLCPLSGGELLTSRYAPALEDEALNTPPIDIVKMVYQRALAPPAPKYSGKVLELAVPCGNCTDD